MSSLKTKDRDRLVHPNYDWGVRGQSIGILSQPVPMESVFPIAYQKIMRDFVVNQSKKKETKGERKGEPVEKEKARVAARSQQLGVGIGIPSADYRGAINEASVPDLLKLTAFLNIAFPNVVINTDANTFDTVINSDKVKAYRKGDDIIYGVTVDGDVYINPDVHSSKSKLFNTAIHEMGHVWTDYIQTTKKGKEIYSKGSEIVQQTDTFKEQLKIFNGNVEKATNEAMAILIGNKGETIIDGATKSDFQDWLLGMWEYIKSQFKMSKDLTADDVQNMTLDTFLQTAIADILSGQEIKMSKAQKQKLKNPDAMFRASISMQSIIEIGRRNGMQDESIKVVLLDRGFNAKKINEALEVNFDLITLMPREFGNIEEGVIAGLELFTSIKEKLQRFATAGPRGGVGTTQTKSFSEIREKAQEILKAEPVYQQQAETVQLELQSALDRSLGIRSNTNVKKNIAEVRAKLEDRFIGAKTLKDAQRRMRMLIRTSLPKFDSYTRGVINRLNKVINDTTEKNFKGQATKVFNEIEKVRKMVRVNLIKKIKELVKSKSKAAITASKKRRAKGIDAVGQSYFQQVYKVLDAAAQEDVSGTYSLSAINR
jgi:hypothetical protein